MSPEAFQADVDVAKRQVEAAERRGFWMRLLTFGLLDNREVTAFARERLNECQARLCQYKALLSEAGALDELLKQTIVLEGVRVSKHTFADLPVLGGADYGVNWEQLRDVVLTRDGYACQKADGLCQGPLQIHHIVPLSRGGPNDMDNLITLCLYHHCAKHPHMRGQFNGSLWC